jgi:hypothetical protein
MLNFKHLNTIMTTLKSPGFKKLTLKSLLTIVGGLIIFISWIAQQHEANTAAASEKLKRSQLVVDIEEVQRTITEMDYLEQAGRRPIEPLRLATAKTNLADCYMRLLAWSQGRVDDSGTKYANLIDLKNKYDAENRAALLMGRYGLIDTNFNTVVTHFQQDFRDLDSRFTARYHGAEQDDEQSSFWFYMSYGLGSLLVGISYLLKGE